MNPDDLLPWFRLKGIPRIGNILYKRLIDHFKTPEAVFKASLEDLVLIEGISLQLAEYILKYKMSDDIKKEIDQTYSRGFQIITMSDQGYPKLLLEIPDPPPLLYVYGQMQNELNQIAVVGSRNATAYGLSTTKRISGELVRNGFTIISGMARGIDTAAHEGALMAGGKTVAVLGSGLTRIYPACNKQLFREISENGAVISEFSLFTEPLAHHFPLRNRIISGIALGTLVVEAASRSGSLITARLASEQNREVFAVPGSVKSHKSRGAHSLLKQGAKLVESANDIIEELAPLLLNPSIDNSKTTSTLKDMQTLDSDELKVYQTLNAYPDHIDDIARSSAIPIGKLSGILLNLELKGFIKQLPGKLFSIDEEPS